MNVLGILMKIWNWIKDPKNRSIVMILIIALLTFLLFKQCQSTQKAKQETKRVQNNWEASLDTIKQYMKDNGTLRGEKQAYQLTLSELKNEYKDLFKDLDEWRKQPPKTIIHTEVKIIEKIKYIPVKVDIDENGNGKFIFSNDTIFNEGNYRKINGIIPFKQRYYSKNDSTEISLDSLNYYGKPYPGLASFELEQGLNLLTGLSYDKKTKKPIIWVETKYPGITFTKIDGADIVDNKTSMDALKKTRKQWGIGFHGGYGIILGDPLKTAPYLGVGLTFTPKFLQF